MAKYIPTTPMRKKTIASTMRSTSFMTHAAAAYGHRLRSPARRSRRARRRLRLPDDGRIAARAGVRAIPPPAGVPVPAHGLRLPAAGAGPVAAPAGEAGAGLSTSRLPGGEAEPDRRPIAARQVPGAVAPASAGLLQLLLPVSGVPAEGGAAPLRPVRSDAAAGAAHFATKSGISCLA